MRHAFLQFSPPRHPLARAGLALVGLGILGLLSALGLALAALVVTGFALRSAWRRIGQPTARPSTGPRVLEGEYRVVTPADRQHLASR
jgi:hypothetical protein